jgi:hypothetical protein
MDDRLKIPALAILGLSFTDCADREPAPDPIVGDWQAISVDAQKFPVHMGVGNSTLDYGYALSVEDDLAGDFAFYYEYGYAGIHERSELASDLVVDDSTAPKYRIEVAAQPASDSDEPPPSDSSADHPDDPYADGGDYGTTGGDDTGGYGSTGDLLVDDARPIVLPGAPDRAPAELVMNCTLDGDILTCAREGDGSPQKWVFKRKRDDE